MRFPPAPPSPTSQSTHEMASASGATRRRARRGVHFWSDMIRPRPRNSASVGTGLSRNSEAEPVERFAAPLNVIDVAQEFGEKAFKSRLEICRLVRLRDLVADLDTFQDRAEGTRRHFFCSRGHARRAV